MCCCYLIASSRSLFWSLLSIATLLTGLAALISPAWLVGTARSPPTNRALARPIEANAGNMANNRSLAADEDANTYSPTIGIFQRCTKQHHFNQLYIDGCGPFVSSFEDAIVDQGNYPMAFKVALLLYGIGLGWLCLTIIMSVVAICIRSICKKSIFTISGSIQAIAGLFLLLGVFCYPLAWSHKRVRLVCGDSAYEFWPGNRQIGSGLYLAAISTVATFGCALLSIQAEHSTSTDKIQEEIDDGKQIICLL